mmetsp:Transcript_39045/g.66585  ORF Transcript_39045/g.66585 Transcript_39045/m.66585 type:complete len:157 (+) Transcript_39045:88-558(+)
MRKEFPSAKAPLTQDHGEIRVAVVARPNADSAVSSSQQQPQVQDSNFDAESSRFTTLQKHKSDDPFLCYSDDTVRLKILKYEEVDETSLSEVKAKSSTRVRKTRLSFELHPSVLLEDFLDEMYGTESKDSCDFNPSDFELQGDESELELLALLKRL